jgi:beta-phosphoglucomutase-like phosphatase (HAD superfamily)
MPADTADQLRAIVRTEVNDLPPSVAKTGDPVEVLAYAATISPALATRVDAQLTEIETTVSPDATGAAYLDDALAACRDSGRSTAVIGRCSADAIQAHLAANGFPANIRGNGPTSYPPGHLDPLHELLTDTLHVLNAHPSECALITATIEGVQAAHDTGLQLIGYATTPTISDRLTAAGATCIIPSLADLTLRLRARPLS